jgi:hypothetical protein
MVCGLGGGIGFMYAVFEYTGTPPLFTIVAQHHPEPWLPAVLGRLGIRAREGRSTSAVPALAALRENLAEGRAVWCSVDRARLPWHVGALAMSSEAYPVVVAGKHGEDGEDGEDGCTLYVDDLDPAPHALPEESFVRAWSGHAKGRHHRLTIEPATGPALTAAGLVTAVRSAVDTTVAHLTGPVLGNSFDVNFGLSGMARFATQLRDTRTKTGWRRRFAEPGAFAWAMRRLHQCLELEYTAPGATRALYADFLDESAPLLDDDRLAEAAALFRESSAQWSRLADRGAEIADDLGDVTELAERRIALVLTRGKDAATEIRALTDQLAALQPPALDPGLLDELADLVDSARSTEESAVPLLRGGAGSG